MSWVFEHGSFPVEGPLLERLEFFEISYCSYQPLNFLPYLSLPTQYSILISLEDDLASLPGQKNSENTKKATKVALNVLRQCINEGKLEEDETKFYAEAMVSH